jgi:GAF domain-containing protein/anti-sigma regulatory factor (Ser/Thr protein kinase)
VVDRDDGALVIPGSSVPGSPGEALLRAALDTAFDGFALLTAVHDGTGRLVDFAFHHVNEVGAKLSGLTAPEFVGRRLTELWPSTVASGLFARYAAVASSGEVFLGEHVDRPSGTVWEIKATRVAPHVVALSYRDVTTHVRQREQLADSEEDARRAAGRIAALQAVTASLAGAVTVTDVLTVMQEKVLALAGADGLIVMLLEEGWLVVRHNTGFKPPEGRGQIEFATDGPAAVARAVRLREPMFFASRTEFLDQFPGHRAAVEGADKHAWTMLPLVSAARVIGAMIISYDREHAFTRDERESLVIVSELCAQALERAQLFEAQKSIAADLQRALLPAVLPTLPGARHAARYLPWTHGADVGGDWYDLIELGPDSVAVVIGDVAGHSTSAAATMGQLRNAIRAYALEGHSPTGVIGRVNRLVTRLDPNAMATCCYLEVHLDEGTATGVLAGHPPPILRTGGAVAPLDLRIGVPLGTTPRVEYVDTTVLLPPGSSLLLYTDGLVEDRRYPIEVGMVDLCRVVKSAPDDDPDAIADWVLSADVWPHARTDDVALLALTTHARPGEPGRATAERRFPGDASSAPSARRFAGDLLDAWGLTSVADTARLLLGEVITNAVQHTVGEVRVRLVHATGAGRLRVEVIDGSDRPPDLRVVTPDAESGRGLFIVETLADRWGHEIVETGGKIVWFELRTR